MTLVDGAYCTQTGCPLVEKGICLDGFPDPAECPHETVAGVELAPVDHGDETSPEAEIETLAPTPRTLPAFIGGEQGLTVGEADRVVRARDSRVVLVAGLYDSGKTTLVVEEFARFLEGPVDGWSFGGSQTLRAFDILHKPSRVSSGATRATTPRTQSDDMRLLDLDLASDRRRIDLLFSDVKGEFFEDLSNGANVREAVPLASRTDLCALVLDGASLGDEGSMGMALWKFRQLLGGLLEPGGIPRGIPLAVVITKADLVPAEEVASIEARVRSDIRDLVEQHGADLELFLTSARPSSPLDAPAGLDVFLEWCLRDRRARELATFESPQSGRYSWRPEVGA